MAIIDLEDATVGDPAVDLVPLVAVTGHEALPSSPLDGTSVTVSLGWRSVRLDKRAASKHRFDEVAVRMAAMSKCAHDRVYVELRGTVLDRGASGVAVDDHPARRTERPRESDTSRVQDADTVDPTICRIVGVSADDPIAVDSGQEAGELSIGRRCVKPWAVVGARRRMNTQDGRAVHEPRGLALRKVLEQPKNPSLIEDASGPGGTGRHQAIPANEILVSHGS